ncbi:MAG: isoprenylcysteine carboxylmethyltransferase family protein, partial [Bacteroidota bacterium]|nr:isoprenylcysteine carboxylmethyltransferase family protein [Bacteroidota bacterium]
MQTLNEIVFFAFVSLLLAYISRKSLRVPGSHGFYRFFAWETILALLITNIGKWFFNPFSLRQIISWI